MVYQIKINEILKITETSGTIQNTSQINKVELSDTENFTDNIILYPLQKLTFQNQLYARLFDNTDLPVELRVIPIQLGGGGSSGGGGSLPTGETIATNAEFKEMLDEVLPMGDDKPTPEPTPPAINGEIATDAEFDEMLNDIGF